MVIFFYPQQWFCLLHHYREFIETHYVPVKQSNPNFPILIRECSDIQPRVWARYGKCNFGNLLALAILLSAECFGGMKHIHDHATRNHPCWLQ